MCQLVTQVPPSSTENACSQWAESAVVPDQMKRTRTVAEEVIGPRLPAGHKELFILFGEGEFSGCLDLYPPVESDTASIASWLRSMRSAAETIPYAREGYAPHGVFTPGGTGLLPWGGSVQADEFCWLVDGGDPDTWPVVTRSHSEGWRTYPMTMSEFVYRVLDDVGFEDFTVADTVDPPYFEAL
ncbi:SMI1/KNR4 family protein [Streptomyces sp. NPDC102274]|uniref:SMI1/KNR4 family protein n=1 Tax=Streptomyces sp. NPDC102274 TaxID=3366151 RepID=UPI00383061F2